MADHKHESTYCCGQEHSKQVSETCCSHKDSHIHPDHDHDHSTTARTGPFNPTEGTDLSRHSPDWTVRVHLNKQKTASGNIAGSGLKIQHCQ